MTGRISLGMTLDAGSIRVPNPAATITALVTFMYGSAPTRFLPRAAPQDIRQLVSSGVRALPAPTYMICKKW